jgi:hypothetical protein
MPTAPPTLPFPEFKWIWASRQPTEGLIRRPVFLGVLRAMARQEGKEKNSEDFRAELESTENRLRTRIDLGNLRLAREPERNLLRNAGQYFETVGLLEPVPGIIRLTPLGRRLAQGDITPVQFAAGVIGSMTLPNPNLSTDWSAWHAVGLEVRPLRLIMATLLHLRSAEVAAAHLTVEELTRVMIPLSAVTGDPEQHATALQEFRTGALDMARWPNCTPAANDKRIAHEFLRFLETYGFIRCDNPSATRDQQRYSLVLSPAEAHDLLEATAASTQTSDAVALVSGVQGDLFSDRERVQTERWARPGQRQFRQAVLGTAGESCLVTGVQILDVLDAAHLIPVEDGGSDDVGNGICLRKDIHRLFDVGHLRIAPDGTVHLSEALRQEQGYEFPDRVTIPSYMAREALEWRFSFE